MRLARWAFPLSTFHFPLAKRRLGEDKGRKGYPFRLCRLAMFFGRLRCVAELPKVPLTQGLVPLGASRLDLKESESVGFRDLACSFSTIVEIGTAMRRQRLESVKSHGAAIGSLLKSSRHSSHPWSRPRIGCPLLCPPCHCNRWRPWRRFALAAECAKLGGGFDLTPSV